MLRALRQEDAVLHAKTGGSLGEGPAQLLMVAVEKGWVDMCRYLIDQGALIGSRNGLYHEHITSAIVELLLS